MCGVYNGFREVETMTKKEALEEKKDKQARVSELQELLAVTSGTDDITKHRRKVWHDTIRILQHRIIVLNEIISGELEDKSHNILIP
jgi:hypothetical protein